MEVRLGMRATDSCYIIVCLQRKHSFLFPDQTTKARPLPLTKLQKLLPLKQTWWGEADNFWAPRSNSTQHPSSPVLCTLGPGTAYIPIATEASVTWSQRPTQRQPATHLLQTTAASQQHTVWCTSGRDCRWSQQAHFHLIHLLDYLYPPSGNPVPLFLLGFSIIRALETSHLRVLFASKGDILSSFSLKSTSSPLICIFSFLNTTCFLGTPGIFSALNFSLYSHNIKLYNYTSKGYAHSTTQPKSNFRKPTVHALPPLLM